MATARRTVVIFPRVGHASCSAELSQVFDARAAEHSAAIMEEQGEPDGFAAHCAAQYDDAEGAAWVAGMAPGKL
mgnify:FL=1